MNTNANAGEEFNDEEFNDEEYLDYVTSDN